MRRTALLIVVMLAGCQNPLGPFPVVDRLDPEQQQVVDRSWLNMFSPPERLDRSLLLDTLVTNHFYQQGVDRLTLTSEKEVWGGRVTMTVSFDRQHPAFDLFTVTYVDALGEKYRHERFSFDEVREHASNGWLIPTPDTQPATVPAEIEKQREQQREYAARLGELYARHILIQLATRPADEAPRDSEFMPPAPP